MPFGNAYILRISAFIVNPLSNTNLRSLGAHYRRPVLSHIFKNFQ